jgi:iron complex outermembrane receptor protein
MPMPLLLFWSFLVITPTFVWGQGPRNDGPGKGGPENDRSYSLPELSLKELLRQNPAVYRDSKTASGVNETLRDAPAAMVVIDQQVIQRRAYTSLDQLLQDLPGFDTVVTNGTSQVVAYQRGYRSPWTQRTLFMVNGKVDNNLWNHSAQISRQYPMNAIERVEVLYGPAGAIYGPNAFLGVINIITRDGRNIAEGASYADTTVQLGSHQTRSIDIALGGNNGVFAYNLGARLFSSDEADISAYAPWGYTDEAWLRDADHWGAGIGEGSDPLSSSPVGDINLDGQISSHERFNGRTLGEYADPTKNVGFVAEVHFAQLTLGVIRWRTDEGYGPYYSFADVQPNVSWVHESNQYYLEASKRYSDQLSSETELVYRSSRVGGDWVESYGDYVSISDWNSLNSAWRVEQKYTYLLNPALTLNAGVKYEQKTLTKAYMTCNYWDASGVCPAQAASSSNGVGSDGSGVIAAELISSENPTPFSPGLDPDNIPGHNQAHTSDMGAYLQAIWDVSNWRLNGSVRWDNNSEYGSKISPRGAAIYHLSSESTLKLIYGEAFQEPSPKDLYGGFNARADNPDLKLEHARNLELVFIHQHPYLLSDMSLYGGHYDDVIAGGQNVGERDIYGFEYRGRYRLSHFLANAADMTGHIYYTYTHAEAQYQYNNVSGEWDDQRDVQGDVAPHKLNFTFNLPLNAYWHLNLKANWVSDRELFSQNPLRKDSNANRDVNRQAPAYHKFDLALGYQQRWFRVGLKIENVFEQVYYHPGVEGAGSGDNFTLDADGFQNSLIPQVQERVFSITFSSRL